jgi:hypothetical protein
MLSEAQVLRTPPEYLTWSHRCARLVLPLVFFGGAALPEFEATSEARRSCSSMLGAIGIISTVWQAVDFTLTLLEYFKIPRVRGSDGVL